MIKLTTLTITAIACLLLTGCGKKDDQSAPEAPSVDAADHSDSATDQAKAAGDTIAKHADDAGDAAKKAADDAAAKAKELADEAAKKAKDASDAAKDKMSEHGM